MDEAFGVAGAGLAVDAELDALAGGEVVDVDAERVDAGGGDGGEGVFGGDGGGL